MKRLLNKLMPVAAVAVASIMAMPSSAYAETGSGAAAVTGAGTISPGLTTAPTFQSQVSFTGTATGGGVSLPVQGTDVADVAVFRGIACTFTGSSIIAEDLNESEGQGVADCSGSATVESVTGPMGTGSVTIHCQLLHYSRIGPVVVIETLTRLRCTLTIQIGGHHTGSTVDVVGAFLWFPGQLPPAPVTSYTMAGVAVFAGTGNH